MARGPKKPRDTKAEYARRKARLAGEGTTLFRRRQAAARALGYTGLRDQISSRARGELSFTDQARHAESPERGYITDIGGNRRTWVNPMRSLPDGLTAADKRSLHNVLRAAHRAGEPERPEPLEMRVTITAHWKHPDGRAGTATAGGSYGSNVARYAGAGPEDTWARVLSDLRAVGVSNLPPGAIVVQLSLFIFPISEGREAAA